MLYRLAFLLALCGPIAAFGQGTTYKALFIGNSYTAFNNLPNLVANLADSSGDSLIYTAHTPGGAQL